MIRNVSVRKAGESDEEPAHPIRGTFLQASVVESETEREWFIGIVLNDFNAYVQFDPIEEP